MIYLITDAQTNEHTYILLTWDRVANCRKQFCVQFCLLRNSNK